MSGAATGLLVIQDTYNLDARNFLQHFPDNKTSVQSIANHNDGLNLLTPGDIMALYLKALEFQWYEKSSYSADLAERVFLSKKE